MQEAQPTPSFRQVDVNALISEYAKQEADSKLNEEHQRRKEASRQRFEVARRILNEKTHMLLINEIQHGGVNKRSDQKSMMIMENEYRNQVLGQSFSVQRTEDKAEISFQEGQLFKTMDNNRQLEDEVIEEMAKLSEKPHPQPEKPRSSMQIDPDSILQENFKPEYTPIKRDKADFPRQMKSTLEQRSLRASQKLKQTIMSPPSQKVIYRNNFTKDSKFVEKAQKDLQHQTITQNLNLELTHLLKSYEKSKDADQVEDMILELHRMTQRSNGLVPAQQQAKIQSYVSNLEMTKVTYSSQRRSKSPSQRNSLTSSTPLKAKLNHMNSSRVNVNSQILKEIITNTESRVRQSMTRGRAQTALHSQRESMERSSMLPEPQLDLMQVLTQAVNDINARILAKFLKRKQIQQGDYEVAYLLALLVALVDESLPLTNDKSDIMMKSWEDLCRQLSNHGKIVYSLQKLRLALEKEDFQKHVNKVQFLKRYEEHKHTLCKSHPTSVPIVKFLEQVAKLLVQMRSQAKQSFTQLESQFNSTQGYQSTKVVVKSQYNSQSTANYNTSQSLRQFMSHRSSPKAMQSPSKSSTYAISSQLLKQKQMAIEKSYQLQMDQSRSILTQKQNDYQKQLDLAKLKLETKAYQSQINRQDKEAERSKQRQEELDYIKHKSDFNHKMDTKERSEIEEEKLRVRERSLENQEFKRQFRASQQQAELKYYREESLKSQRDLQWKDQQRKQKLKDKVTQLTQKHQEVMMGKIKQSENFLNHKEQELDERLKVQFESATTKYRTLQKQEDQLKTQMQVLKQAADSRRTRK